MDRNLVLYTTWAEYIGLLVPNTFGFDLHFNKFMATKSMIVFDHWRLSVYSTIIIVEIRSKEKRGQE